MALITGGDSGIGRSVGLLLAKEGAKAVCIAYTEKEQKASGRSALSPPALLPPRLCSLLTHPAPPRAECVPTQPASHHPTTPLRSTRAHPNAGCGGGTAPV